MCGGRRRLFSSVPTAGDLYLMRRVMHGWSDESAIVILRNCRKAMRQNGRPLIVEYVLAEEGARNFQ
jgi:hypothetical protein